MPSWFEFFTYGVYNVKQAPWPKGAPGKLPLRATGIDMQGAQYGPPVPVVYGMNKVAGNVIWYGDFKATPQTQNAGKGGGGSGITGYSYSSSFELVLCEGPITGFGNIYQGNSIVSLASLNGTLKTGTAGQAAWSHLTGSAALGYTLKALFAAQNLSLGSTASIPNLNFEVQGLLYGTASGGGPDANPSDILNDLATNADHGINFNFLGSLTQYFNYCAANSLFVSPVYDRASTASSVIDDLMKYSNTLCYYSEGQLKLVPLGDTSVTGNGVTFTPSVATVADLGPPQLLAEPGAPAVRITRKAPQDCLNLVRLEYTDRSYFYHTMAVAASIDNDMISNGVRAEQNETADMITLASVAKFVAQNLVQRAFYVRNSYEFELPPQWSHLEPTDLVTLTDSNTGLNKQPVRLLEITEDENGRLKCVAEEFPQGIGHSIAPAAQGNSGANIDQNIDPGPVTAPYIFRGPGFLVNNNLPEIWCALDGGANWAGANIYMSHDNITYTWLDTFARRSRYGALYLPTWLANNVQALGQLIQDSNGNTQQVTAITSDDKTGGSAPAWATTVGLTTTDNHVTWTCRAVKLAAPGAPTLGQVAGGTLAATTYFAKCTWLLSDGVSETTAGTEANLAVSLNNVLTVTQPASPPAGAAYWKVYLSNTAGGGSGAETLQSALLPIATTLWQEPNTGLVAGISPPSTNTTGLLPLPNTADTDTTNLPWLTLNNGETLLGGSQSDADNMITLAMVDSEIISYQTATLEAGPAYQLTYLRRGAYNSAVAAHTGNAPPFVRLDENIYRMKMDPSLIGQTIYLKFLSFNAFGRTPRSLSSETAYPYVVGTNQELPDVPAVPGSFAIQAVADGVHITWVNSNKAAVGATSVEFSPDGTTWTVLAQVGSASEHYDHQFLGATKYYYRARARGPLPQSGFSAYTAVLNTTSFQTTMNTLSAMAQTGKNGCPNPGFEQNVLGLAVGNTLTAPGAQITDGWAIETNSGVNTTNWQFQLNSSNNRSGQRTLLISLPQNSSINNGTTAFATVKHNALQPVKQGNTVTFGGWVNWTNSGVSVPAGNTAHAYFSLDAYDVNGVRIGNLNVSPSVADSSVYGLSMASTTIPATLSGTPISFVKMGPQVDWNNASGSTFFTLTNSYANVYFDDCFMTLDDNVICLGFNGITLSYTSTTTSITITWTAGTLYFSDGSTVAVAASTGGTQLSFTGLTANTTYYFYIYIQNTAAQAVAAAGGALGGPSAAQLAAQSGGLNIPLKGTWAITTPASGSGGGGGGLGGCLHPLTPVQVRRAGDVVNTHAGQIVVGDEVQTPEGEWTPVLHVMRKPCDAWIAVIVDVEMEPSQEALVTPEQPLYRESGSIVNAGDLKRGDRLRVGNGKVGVVDKVVTAREEAEKVILFLPPPHIYVLQPEGLWLHNGNPKP